MNGTNKHIIQLDGLRFFAVLMVMVAHWLQWQWTDSILTNTPFVRGVTLFFVLSGFLISTILLTHRDWYDQNLKSKLFLIKNFYMRRFLRIFPIYYLLLGFLFVINYENTRELFPWLISYSSNIYQSIHNTYVGSFNHFWSLAVEEQFYLFWPFVILFVKPNKTLFVIIVTIVLSLLSRYLLFVYTDKWMATAYFTLCCMQALGLGALLAYIKKYKTNVVDRLSNPIILYSFAALYVMLLIMQNNFEMNWYKSVWEEFMFSIVSFFIILRASQSKFKGVGKFILENRFVRYAGKISYGMYVYHAFMPSLFYVLAPKIGLSISDKYVFFIALYILTLIVSVLSWNLIEAPLNKLKDKFPYKRIYTQ